MSSSKTFSSNPNGSRAGDTSGPSNSFASSSSSGLESSSVPLDSSVLLPFTAPRQQLPDDTWMDEILHPNRYIPAMSFEDVLNDWSTPAIEAEWEALTSAPKVPTRHEPDAITTSQHSAAAEREEPSQSLLFVPPASPETPSAAVSEALGDGQPAVTGPLASDESPSSSKVLNDITNDISPLNSLSVPLPSPSRIPEKRTLPPRKAKKPIALVDASDPEDDEALDVSVRPVKRRKVEASPAAKEKGKGKAQGETNVKAKMNAKAVTKGKKKVKAGTKRKGKAKVKAANNSKGYPISDEEFALYKPDTNDHRLRHPKPSNTPFRCLIAIHRPQNTTGPSTSRGVLQPCNEVLTSLASAEQHFISVHNVPRNKHADENGISCPWMPCPKTLSGSVMRHVLARHAEPLHMYCARCRKKVSSRNEMRDAHFERTKYSGKEMKDKPNARQKRVQEAKNVHVSRKLRSHPAAALKNDELERGEGETSAGAGNHDGGVVVGEPEAVAIARDVGESTLAPQSVVAPSQGEQDSAWSTSTSEIRRPQVIQYSTKFESTANSSSGVEYSGSSVPLGSANQSSSETSAQQSDDAWTQWVSAELVPTHTTTEPGAISTSQDQHSTVVEGALAESLQLPLANAMLTPPASPEPPSS
ncbi:hypothetical protein CVT24_000815 [Panaeolus cyanescens]|uniref:Uncharacterized protein n=1 Tax=Panaeolus cyanescens TaxID=181874 RepID=A0A409YCV1_9AGAR|nr:hypothetical protein CVT24_000815 [Panaeolus cyanescens]